MDAPHRHVARIVRGALSQPETLGDGDCECLRPGILGQPVNTVTSAAFVAAGAVLGSRLGDLAESRRPAAAAYAAAVALAGVGSLAYHGPQFAGAQALHDLPVLGMLGLGVGVPVIRRRRGEDPVPGLTPARARTTAAVVAASALAYAAGDTRSPLCRPRSLLQWHGLWHLGMAWAAASWGRDLWPAETDPAAAGGEP